MIKFLDLQKINAQYKIELNEAAVRVIDSGWYIWVKMLKNLKKNLHNFVV